jgi:hypothetical protein
MTRYGKAVVDRVRCRSRPLIWAPFWNCSGFRSLDDRIHMVTWLQVNSGVRQWVNLRMLWAM